MVHDADAKCNAGSDVLTGAIRPTANRRLQSAAGYRFVTNPEAFFRLRERVFP